MANKPGESGAPRPTGYTHFLPPGAHAMATYFDVPPAPDMPAPTYTPAADPPAPPETLNVVVDKLTLVASRVPTGRAVRNCSFTWRGARYIGTPDGRLLSNINPNTGTGDQVGTLSTGSGHVTITSWTEGSNTAVQDWAAIAVSPATGNGELPGESYLAFRTSAAPLRPGSFQVVATLFDGAEISATADADGLINHARVKGWIDYESGAGDLIFCNPNPTGLGVFDVTDYAIPGITTVNVDRVFTSSLRYNAVAYEYIPVDPEVVGVDPVRLPSDGRVPIFRPGDYVVVHRAGQMAPATLSNSQTVDTGTTRLSRITIYGADGAAITDGWSPDLDAGTFTVTNIAGWSQPVTVEYAIEHMALVRQLDISGAITLNRALPHAFPAASSHISSALMLGDRFARVSLTFDQGSWDGVTFLDHLVGSAAVGTYNTTVAPIAVDNTGCVTERWAVRFLTGTTFQLIGEHVGVVGSGTVNEDFEPTNPNTGTPYLTIPAIGWGSGWVAGNIVRVNTIGALKGFSCIRAVQPGDYTALEHSFTLLPRIDVDRPPSP